MNNQQDKYSGKTEGMTLAAIDLGSNSFHMVVARASHNEMRPIEAFAERVQLALEMEKNNLCLEAIARGLSCLSRFRQALDTLKPDMVSLPKRANRFQLGHHRTRPNTAGVDCSYHAL